MKCPMGNKACPMNDEKGDKGPDQEPGEKTPKKKKASGVKPQWQKIAAQMGRK